MTPVPKQGTVSQESASNLCSTVQGQMRRPTNRDQVCHGKARPAQPQEPRRICIGRRQVRSHLAKAPDKGQDSESLRTAVKRGVRRLGKHVGGNIPQQRHASRAAGDSTPDVDQGQAVSRHHFPSASCWVVGEPQQGE